MEKNEKLIQELKLQNEIFHIHTYRCGHASKEKEEDYVLKAIELGAKKISFTDHTPFPGNPFGNRMDMCELDDYINELHRLQMHYKDDIQISIGLEIEYLPSFNDYYRKLTQMEGLDNFILGQHFYKDNQGGYSFSYPSENKKNEARGLCDAMIEGIHTGLFSTVAHPDRIFRRNKEWTDEMTEMSMRIIEAAVYEDVYLEKNISSMKRKQYREEFWGLVPKEAKTIVGCDAHSVKEINVYGAV